MTTAVMPENLPQWLAHISKQHHAEMDLGLRRVSVVAQRMAVQRPAPCTVIVAGTNGKGSTITAAEAALRQAGFVVGATLSPHVQRFNERIRLQGADVDDVTLCAAFMQIENARGEVPLTYFEYATLASLWIFAKHPVDVALLEVGLGGRLDAYNLVDADIAVITSIGFDHQSYLGNTLALIGAEKAGVLRAQQTAVLGRDLPDSVFKIADELGTTQLIQDVDFGFSALESQQRWLLSTQAGVEVVIQAPQLAPINLSLGLQVAERVSMQLNGLQNRSGRLLGPEIGHALSAAALLGRLQQASYRGREVILDVGHNPLAAQMLLEQLRLRYPQSRVVAVFAQLVDKDPGAVVDILRDRIAHWVLAPSSGLRKMPALQLQAAVSEFKNNTLPHTLAESVPQALDLAWRRCAARDVILVFGAFSVVEDTLQTLSENFQQ